MSAEPFLVRFARNWGWRAYAIPVLLVITVWVLVDVVSSRGQEPAPEQAAAPATQENAAAEAPGQEGPDPAEQSALVIELTQLPPGGAFTEAGEGTYRVVGTPGAGSGEGAEKVVRYVVEIEDGVDTSGVGGDDAVAAMVDATLNNPKGWTADPRFGFQHVSSEEAGGEDVMHIQLTSVETTHSLCGDDLGMETSCYYSDGNRVVLNESRWVRGATPFQGDVGSYRQYLINHEVGHGLGYASHEACSAEGELAPVMMQQTLSLNNSELHGIDPNEVYPDNGMTCRYNPWPYPKAS